MATILRSSMPDIYLARLANLDEVIYKQREIPLQGMQFYNIRGCDGSFINDTTISGFGIVPEKAENEKAASDVIYQGFDKKYTPVVYELAYSVSREAIDDNNDFKIAKNAEALSRSFRATKEINLALPFNTGFDTMTSADGQYIFSSSHNKLPSGTQSNTTSADLSVATLQTIINSYADTTDYRGLLLALKPGRLIVPQELWWLATEILQSPDRPDTSARSINALHRQSIEVIPWNYLTDPDAFFLLPKTNREHDLNFVVKDEFETAADIEFLSGNLLYKGHERYTLGVTEWAAMFGSAGA